MDLPFAGDAVDAFVARVQDQIEYEVGSIAHSCAVLE